MATRRPPARPRAPERDELRRDRADQRPPRAPAPPRSPWPKRNGIGLGALVFGFLSGFALRGSGPQISTIAPAQDAHLGAAATEDLQVRISSDLPSLMSTATLDYDGGNVIDQAYVGDGEIVYRPRDRYSPELEAAKRRILNALDQSLRERTAGDELVPAAAI